MKKRLIGLGCVLAIAASIVGLAVAGEESKFASHATSAAVTYSPDKGRITLESLFVKTDKATGTAKVYAKGGAGRETPTALPTNGATVVYISNATDAFTTNDLVVYYHAALDTVDYTTISSSTPSNVTLAAGISAAGALGDQLYELTEQGRYFVGSSNALNLDGAASKFVSPTDSPVRIVADGTAAVYQVSTVSTP